MSTIDDSRAEGSRPEAEQPKPLRRSGGDRWIAGVCGGLAAYFGLNAAVYRVLFVALAFAGGTGFLLYLAAALVMPAGGRDESVLAEALRNHRDRPWLVIGMALLALFFAFAVSGPGAFGGPGGSVFWPGAVAFWLVVGLVVVALAWASGRGRRALAALAALVVLLVIGVAGAVAVADGLGATDVVERPVLASELEEEYDLGAGELVLDLRALELPEGETRVEARVGFGELEVIVPEDVAVSATGKVGWGDVSVLGLDGDGRDVRQAVADPGFGEAETRLVIDARVRFGQVAVHR